MVHASEGLIFDGKKLLLILRSATMRHRPLHWALPAGRSEPGETPEETAAREVKEEVGLDFKPGKLFDQRTGSRFEKFTFFGEWSGDILLQEAEVAAADWYLYEQLADLKMSDSYRELFKKLHDEGHF